MSLQGTGTQELLMSKTGSHELNAGRSELHPDSEKSTSVYERFLHDWHAQIQSGRVEPSLQRSAADNSISRHVPDLQLTDNAGPVRDIVIRNASKGTSDTLAGINA